MIRYRPLDGSTDPDPDQRLLDVIFGVVGACSRCLPRRVPAAYYLAHEVKDPELLSDEPGPKNYGPTCTIWALCAECTAEERAADPDPLIPIIKIWSIE